MSSVVFVYVADPMCSWCWGFSRSFRAVRERWADARFQLVLGGLRPGAAAKPLDDGLRDYLRGAWTRVQELTGQPFDWTVLTWEGFVYDTDPASRAVVAVRRIAPGVTLDYYAHMQAGFYRDGLDITRRDVQLALAAQLGVDTGRLGDHLEDPALQEETAADYDFARSLGVTGFPTLLASVDGRFRLLSAGYRPAEEVLSTCQAFLGE